MQGRVQSFVAVHFYPYMRQRGVFVSQFISTMAFGDASNMMSVTSLYAFLVYTNQAQNLLLISGDLQAR